MHGAEAPGRQMRAKDGGGGGGGGFGFGFGGGTKHIDVYSIM